MLPIAEPSTNLSPGSTSGMSAARAEENGTPVSTVQNSSTQSAVKGRPGTAISPTVPIRNRSQTIITRRRGKRSARPESSGPPAIGGR
jgi:hypothetical protein